MPHVHHSVFHLQSGYTFAMLHLLLPLYYCNVWVQLLAAYFVLTVLCFVLIFCNCPLAYLVINIFYYMYKYYKVFKYL